MAPKWGLRTVTVTVIDCDWDWGLRIGSWGIGIED